LHTSCLNALHECGTCSWGKGTCCFIRAWSSLNLKNSQMISFAFSETGRRTGYVIATKSSAQSSWYKWQKKQTFRAKII
jgi:hypothetical protein